MSTTEIASTQTVPVAAGTWRVDPKAGHLRFRVKSMWGLVPVNGEFASYEGRLEIDQAGAASGELVIAAATLDTHNAKRDAHLRSADFFGASEHPTLRFTVADVAPRPGGLTIAGDLEIAGRVARLEMPVTVTRLGDDRLRLQATTSVPREDVGLTWNRAGMIRGSARLDVELDVVRSR